MTGDLAAVRAAVDSAVPPGLDAEWARARQRRPSYLVHRRVHLPCGRQVASVLRPGDVVPVQGCAGTRSAGPGAGSGQERALAQALRDAFRDLGDVAGPGAVFVRVTRAFLAGDLPVPTRPDRVVAELDGRSACDDVLMDGLLRLKSIGCRVSLGDFTGRRDQRRLLPLADYVKIDARDLDVEGRPLVELASSRGAEVVAEFVDNDGTLDRCRAAGIALVQGRVFETATAGAGHRARWSAAGR